MTADVFTNPGYTDAQFLFWLRNRLVFVYGLDPNNPAVVRLERIARNIKEDK